MNRTEMNAMSDKDLLSDYIIAIQSLSPKAKKLELDILRRMKSTDIQPSEDALNALERLHELSNNDELYSLYSILFDAVHGEGATRKKGEQP